MGNQFYPKITVKFLKSLLRGQAKGFLSINYIFVEMLQRLSVQQSEKYILHLSEKKIGDPFTPVSAFIPLRETSRTFHLLAPSLRIALFVLLIYATRLSTRSYTHSNVPLLYDVVGFLASPFHGGV